MHSMRSAPARRARPHPPLHALRARSQRTKVLLRKLTETQKDRLLMMKLKDHKPLMLADVEACIQADALREEVASKLSTPWPSGGLASKLSAVAAKQADKPHVKQTPNAKPKPSVKAKPTVKATLSAKAKPSAKAGAKATQKASPSSAAKSKQVVMPKFVWPLISWDV